MEPHRAIIIPFSVLSLLLASGCATTYRIATLPAGVSVYHRNGNERAFVGETPLEFEKSGLPRDKPFMLSFEKPGYEKKEIIVTPTDDTMTTISVTLKQAQGMETDETLKRARTVLQKVFEIQDYVVKKRYVDALSALQALEQQEPRLPEVYMLKGSVYFMLEEKALAKQNWEKALEIDPALPGVKDRLQELAGGAPK